ncbi:hypothetical protein C0J52_01295 [Blattella germanica]|nr:hypothetical protein C0J52_01295 [Blattella germanica]
MSSSALPPPSNQILEYVRESAGVSEKRVKEAVKILKDWLKLQPHLPHDYDEGRIERRYIWCKASLERTKSSLDMYYTLRGAVPEILSNRDPSLPWFKQITDLAYCLPMPRLTEDCQRIVLIGNLDPDATNYNLFDIFKLVFMVGDVRFSEDCCIADTYITGSVIASQRALRRNNQDRHEPVPERHSIMSARIKGIHYVNVPPYADVLINFTRSVMKPKIAARIHVHSKGLESLHEKVDKKILPQEFGGDAGPITDLWDAWKEKLVSYRNWFVEQEKLKADESKRPGKKIDSGDIFGFEGSFRQLTVD